LVANPATAREGLTLTEANVAIYVDRTFSLLDYLQSQDRIHRISQNQECFIINLIGKGSIDEFIDYVLYVKQHNAAYIQQDITDPPIIGDITKAQLLQALL
jgi:SNF2 family DNA or RNA helicase